MEGGTEGDEGKECKGTFVPCFKSESDTSSVAQSKPRHGSAASPCLIAIGNHSVVATKLSPSPKKGESSTDDVTTDNQNNPLGGANTSPPISPLASSQSCKPLLTLSPHSGEERESGTMPHGESVECDSPAKMASSPSSQNFPNHNPLHCPGGQMGGAFGLFSHPPTQLTNHSQLATSNFFLPDETFGQLKLQKLQSRHPSGNMSCGKRKPWITSTPAAMGETGAGSSQCEVEMAVCPPSSSLLSPRSPQSGTGGSAPPKAGLGHMGDPLVTHSPDSRAISQGSHQECGLTCSLTKMERGRALEASADSWSTCHHNQVQLPHYVWL